MRRRLLSALLVAVALLAGGASAARAQTTGSPPATASGPPLATPVAQLDAALVCSGDLEGSERPPVLLVHGTALDVRTNFSWSYVDRFEDLSWPFCTVELPDVATVDIQTSAEYVVHAIRTMSARSGDEIQILGFSQGGMLPRWVFKYWPDTRDRVEELVSLSGSHHGTLGAYLVCAVPCKPAVLQQATESNFLDALNNGPETYPEVDYTSIYTRVDEIVFPNIAPPFASSVLEGGANVVNVAVQDVCPNRFPEHLRLGTSDPVGYAVAVDALTNDGPANPARVDRAACLRPHMPGVTTGEFAVRFPQVLATAVAQLADPPLVRAEPPLRPYAAADDPDGPLA